MKDSTTGAMQQFGASPSPESELERGAGLVLLYADGHETLPGGLCFDQPRLVLGREASSDLCIPVQSVSRRHVEFQLEAGRWWLQDLGSRNGTLVDGQRVHRAALEPHQEVRAGDVILKFVAQQSTEYAKFSLTRPLELHAIDGHQGMIGGFQMQRIARDLKRIAPSNLSVMLLGESGTGKEVFAKELHRLSGRRGPFNAINCAAIPGQLLESELFGYKRGAFSGADRDKPGLIQSANHGTLLLDEIGDMPLEAQAKLLRVLQAKEVFPLGATSAEPVDVRIICATHRDPTRLQQQEKFREDLYARLNEYQLQLPPLRERKEDIFALLNHFLRLHGSPERQLTATFQFMLGLLNYDWPYNIRELEAAAKRCVALANGPLLGAELLPPQVAEAMLEYAKPEPPASSKNLVISTLPSGGVAPPSPTSQGGPTSHPSLNPFAIPDEASLRALLEEHAGNIAAVGRQLGKARMQIHRWVKRYGIQLEDYRK